MTIAMQGKRVRRYDYSTLLVSDTPAGGKKVDAFVTRAGIFEYALADGTMRRELRHPREVFAPESLASLHGATLTDDHPVDMVNPANWKELAIGHVDAPRVEGIYVATQAHVNAADALARLASGAPDELRECSCGYYADYVDSPGEYEGEAYDGYQENIRYNHVALGPKDWGRAGNSVGLRLDGGSDTYGESVLTHPPSAPRKDAEAMKKIFLDGKEYVEGSAEHIAALETKAQRATADATTAAARIVELTKEVETAKAETATEKTRADNAEAAAKPEAIAAAVAKRQTLIDSVRRKDPKFMTDKKDQGVDMSALVVRALKILLPSYNAEGKSPDQLAEALDIALSMQAPGETAPEGDLPADSLEETETGGAGEEEDPLADASAHDSTHSGRGRRDAGNSPALGLDAVYEAARKRRLDRANVNHAGTARTNGSK